MRIAGLQKLTLLDYPGKTACTVFVPGCDFRCPFCHNAELVVGGQAALPEIPEAELFSLLGKRHGLLDGVCVTGGEPTLQPDLPAFCQRVRGEGFAVKLDTNGSRPDVLRALLDAGLVDCVAMDVKNAPERYGETTGLPTFDRASIEASLSLLLESSVPFELRTTVVRELHMSEDLEQLAQWLAGITEQCGRAPADVRWFLQSFEDSDRVLAGAGTLSPWETEDLRSVLPRLQEILPRTALRGVD